MIVDLREGDFEFVDHFANTRRGRQRLFPSATEPASKRVETRS
ncbi:MAG TPA: hypothetical protein VKV17_07540 [Bryobacteraceae bacterium]|nr:hypothetical protein [Bryobacteraceae bacterium]